MGYALVYIVIAILTALGVSAWSQYAAQWGARRCVMIGIFWFISIPIMAITIGYNKYIKRSKR